MAKLKTTEWDSVKYLKTEACLEEDDPALIKHALDVIARARWTKEQRDQH